MPSQRIGIWIIGARGGVASTATLGLLAMRKGLSEPTGLVTALPEFARLDLATWDQFVVGGHWSRPCLNLPGSIWPRGINSSSEDTRSARAPYSMRSIDSEPRVVFSNQR